MRFRLRKSVTLLLVLLAFVCISCKKNVALPPAQAAPPPAPPPPPAPTITITATPGAIDPGQSATITWQSTNAATVSIQPELGNVPSNGIRQVTPAMTVTYSATATGPGGAANSTARVTVNAPPAAPAAPAAAPTAPRTLLPLDQQFTQAVQPIFFDYDQSEIRVIRSANCRITPTG